MRQRIFFCVVCFALVLNSFAQSRLSLYTQRMLKKASPEKTTIDLFVRGDFDSVKKAVALAGGNYKFGYGKYSSVTIPLDNLDRFLENSAITGVESGEIEMVPLMDTAIIVNCVLPVHQGDAPLDTSYKGDGIIVGVIDYGIDINHEDFKKANGDTRIRYLWDQNLSGANPPLPYNYGREWNEFDINNGQCSHQSPLNGLIPYCQASYGHGTNVAGIAAGNGRACNGSYVGMAPNSDLIIVAFNFCRPFLSTFVDAVDFIFKKADAMGKPCVINASLGAYWGSHDGKDPAGLMIDYLLEERTGRSLVAAAGNSGNLAYHLGYDVTEDTSFTWFTYNDDFDDLYFDFWADTQDFNDVYFAIGVEEPAIWSELNRSNFFNVLNDYTFNTSGGITSASINYTQNDTFGNWLGTVATTIYLAQGRYNIEVNIDPLNRFHYWSFITTGSGRIDGWNSAIPGLAIYASDMVSTIPPDSVRPDIVNYKLPDATGNIVSSFQCSEKVITVGNYTNRKMYPDCNSNMVTNAATPGEIFFTSSRGPNRKGIIKPDISATGDYTMATGDSTQITLLQGSGQGERVGYCCKYNRNGGTSMASPVVTGIVALYLEKNPNAGWEEIKQAITRTAKIDGFTGAVPNNTYGYGKVQACDAMLYNAVFGCMDSTAFNYNPAATIDDGSCIPYIYGCTDSAAFNFNPDANTDDGSCEPRVYGCTDSTAINYDSDANTDDGTCVGVGIANQQSQDGITLSFIPNFFREQSRIVYDLGKPLNGKVYLTITNLLGQKIDELNLEEQKGIVFYHFPVNDSGIFFWHLMNESKPLLSGKIVAY